MMLTALIAAPLLLAGQYHAADKNPRVSIQTNLGSIVVEIDAKRAPSTAANFLRYVDEGRYTGGQFHRTVTMQNQPDKNIKIEVIQGGVNPTFADKDYPPIKLERTNVTGIHHKNGTISMARDGADTATSDFFICIGNQPELDYGGKRNPDGQGFAAFGHVTKGMDIVHKIQKSPADGQTLKPPIEIVSITRLTP
jgi:peptidyl-prolyl cis-trans isomerase A (cyclophilin A)